VLSSDSKTLLLLCSHLGSSPDASGTQLKLREWNSLERRLQAASLPPGDILGMNSEDLKNQLSLTEEEIKRLILRFEQLDRLPGEVERLAQMGIRVTTRVDPDYPARYIRRLNESAPVVLFYAGEVALLGQPGIAVVGSRHLDAVGQECAAYVGNACGLSGLILYSGGAKGVDTISMEAALEARGSAVGLLADSLIRAIRPDQVKAAIDRGDLCLATPYAPGAGFSVGAAMGRNRLIYALADYAIVVASDAEQGGTWAGATEALKAGWVPLFVLDHPAMPEGNQQLLQRGGVAFPYPFQVRYGGLRDWLETNARPGKPRPSQLPLM
jgi:predicted Rossmann fold nucleotide-binding protein DprA/Smf involved in DNA uptake